MAYENKTIPGQRLYGNAKQRKDERKRRVLDDEDEIFPFLLLPGMYPGISNGVYLPQDEMQDRPERGIYAAPARQADRQPAGNYGNPSQNRLGKGERYSQLNINYTSSDGTRYHLSVAAPESGRDAAMYNVLCGLYAVMAAEGITGRERYAGAREGGKTPKGYSSSTAGASKH